MKATYLTAAATILAGCSTISGSTKERRATYACNYGPNLTVTYGGSEARIESVDGTVTLRRRPSGSGFWYESATHSLRGEGKEIAYVVRQMAPRECRAT